MHLGLALGLLGVGFSLGLHRGGLNWGWLWKDHTEVVRIDLGVFLFLVAFLFLGFLTFVVPPFLVAGSLLRIVFVQILSILGDHLRCVGC